MILEHYKYWVIILQLMIVFSESRSSKPRHTNTQNLIMSKITKLKKYLIPGGDIDIKKATQALANILENNMNHKITKAKADFESKLLSILDKRILLTAELLRNSKACRDTIQNCENLKENNVCQTSKEAMNKTCRKTCGFCKDIDISLEDIISGVKQDVSKISHGLRPHRIHHFKTRHEEKPQPKPKNKHVKITKRPQYSIKPHKKKRKHPKPVHRTPPKKTVTKPKKIECPEICKIKCLTGCPKKCCNGQAEVAQPQGGSKKIIPPMTTPGINPLLNQNIHQPTYPSFGASQPPSSQSPFFMQQQNSGQYQPYGMSSLSSQSQPNGMSSTNGLSQSYGMSSPSSQSQPNGMSSTNGLSQSYGMSSPSSLSQSNGMSSTNGLSQSYGMSPPNDLSQPYSMSSANGLSQPYSVSSQNDMSPTNGLSQQYGLSQPNGMSSLSSLSQSYGMPPTNGIPQPYSMSSTNGLSQPSSLSQPNGMSSLNGLSQSNGETKPNILFQPNVIPKKTCPPQCQEICSPACPDDCCIQKLFVSIAHHNANGGLYNQPQSNTDLLGPASSYASSLFDKYSSSYTCGDACPSSCYPGCSPECCSNSATGSGNVDQMLMSAVSSSLQEPQLSPSGVDNSLINYGNSYSQGQGMNDPIQPQMQSFDPPQMQSFDQPPVAKSVFGHSFDSHSDQPSSSDAFDDTCPLGCEESCSSECPAQCCGDIIPDNDKSNDQAPNSEIKRCPAACKVHCTPSCVYNHCCED